MILWGGEFALEVPHVDCGHPPAIHPMTGCFIRWTSPMREWAHIERSVPEHADVFRDNAVWFRLHVVCGVLALALGPWQFLGRLCARHPRIHR